MTSSVAHVHIQAAQIASSTAQLAAATFKLTVDHQGATRTHNVDVQSRCLAMRSEHDRVEAENRRETTAREAEAKYLRLLEQLDEQRTTNARLEQESLLLGEQLEAQQAQYI